jgi:hypothetical protein
VIFTPELRKSYGDWLILMNSEKNSLRSFIVQEKVIGLLCVFIFWGTLLLSWKASSNYLGLLISLFGFPLLHGYRSNRLRPAKFILFLFLWLIGGLFIGFFILFYPKYTTFYPNEISLLKNRSSVGPVIIVAPIAWTIGSLIGLWMRRRRESILGHPL